MYVPISAPRSVACVQRARRGFAVSTLILASACATTGRTGSLPAVDPPSCRAAATRAGAAPVRWLAGPAEDDRATLDAWCRGVGPIEHLDAAREVAAAARAIAVVSWNVNVGAGDLGALVSDLRAGRLSGGRVPDGFVLLLQEALRSGGAVPAGGPGQAGARRLVRSAHPHDIVAFARRAQLALFYVPSMRNGSGRGYREDRGNAILATAPISDLRALELPFARQRRVVAVATLALDRSGPALAVASVHLDPFVGAHRLWLFGASDARDRQARVVAGTMQSAGAFVVGGDLNTWHGDDEPAIAAIRRISDDAPHQPEPTYANGRVLDHIFFRVPAGWHVRLSRASHPYGSDHFPVVALIDVPERVSSVLPSRTASPLRGRAMLSIQARLAPGVPSDLQSPLPSPTDRPLRPPNTHDVSPVVHGRDSSIIPFGLARPAVLDAGRPPGPTIGEPCMETCRVLAVGDSRPTAPGHVA